MARSRSRLTAEIDFDRDGKQHGFIRLPYSVHRSAYGWIPIPVACIKNGDGPRVLLMAGNHGDEYEGQVALGKLIRSLEAEEVCGRIIILPSANFPAAMAGMRTSPLDEGNLNRSFPGDPYGGTTMTPRQPSRLASHPVVGVATAVAARLSVTTQAISSFVVESAPRIWGKTTLARVMVIPKSRLDSCTASRISHCCPVMLRSPSLPDVVLIC
jgi:hypothetical protein